MKTENERNWLDDVNDFALAFIEWTERPKVGKTFHRILWGFLIVSILYVIVKTLIDLTTGYTPTL